MAQFKYNFDVEEGQWGGDRHYHSRGACPGGGVFYI